MGHVYNLKKQFKVQIIDILEEIDSFYWPKVHSWKVDKKIWQGPPPPHLDKIQKNSYFFWETFPKSKTYLATSGSILHDGYNYTCLMSQYAQKMNHEALATKNMIPLCHMQGKAL